MSVLRLALTSAVGARALFSPAVCALALALSCPAAANSGCKPTPNGSFEQGLNEWIIEPVIDSQGGASAFIDVNVVDGGPYGRTLDPHVALVSGFAYAPPVNSEDGPVAADARLVMHRTVTAEHRHLTFILAGGWEIVRFGSGLSKMKASVSVLHQGRQAASRIFFDHVSPQFSKCGLGISILGVVGLGDRVSVDVLEHNGQATGISLGDEVEIRIILEVFASTETECDEAETAVNLVVDQFQFCPSPPALLPGDVTGDAAVNIDDLVAVITSWGRCPTPPAACAADIAPRGGSSAVDIDDLVMVITNWQA